MILRVLPRAESEIAEAILFLDERAPGRGDNFLKALDATIGRVLGRPRQFGFYEGAPLRNPLRRAIVERFPYLVLFHADDVEVVVVAVAHASRRPGYWEMP
ncbi:MAG: type II toxin-antitoxin system RelE/ParE family toxin [Lacipirellulaceae bacterium]